MSAILHRSQSPRSGRTPLNITARVLAVALMAAPVVTLAGSQPAVAASPPLDSGEQPVAGEVTSISGLGCMDNKGGNDPLNGSTNPVQLSNCNAAINTGSIGKQLWTVEPDSTIRMYFPWNAARASANTTATGAYKCLHADSDSTVGLWDCNGTSWEDWTFQVVTGNQYVLKVTGKFSSANGNTVTKCLAEQGSGAQLAMVSCVPTNTSQQWDMPANTQVHQAAPAMLNLNSYYDPAGGLFVNPSNQTCTTTSKYNYVAKKDIQEYGGNCWWWAANGLYSMVDFLEHAGSAWLGSGSISNDISNTYDQLCLNASGTNTCPTNPEGQQDTSLTNPFQNNYFDDTANWALFWMNAYEYTVSQGATYKPYLYLTENLWHYITQYGWDEGGHNWTCQYPGGIVQTTTNSNPAKNLGVNSLYLRLSAWLYVATGNTDFRDGIADTSGSATDGGYVQEANWLFPTLPTSHLTLYDQSTFPNVPLIFNGELKYDSTTGECSVPTSEPKETQHEGMMIGALVDLYDAGLKSTGNSSNQLIYLPSYYVTIADNLAETFMTDTGWTSPPAVDQGILNESGDSIGNETNDPWGDEITGTEPWIPGKGIFMRNLYCLNTVPLESGALPAGKVASFIHASASSIAQNDQNLDTNYADDVLNYNEFGYWWQGDPYVPGDGPLSFQAELSAAEPIAAAMDNTATTMC